MCTYKKIKIETKESLKMQKIKLTCKVVILLTFTASSALAQNVALDSEKNCAKEVNLAGIWEENKTIYNFSEFVPTNPFDVKVTEGKNKCQFEASLHPMKGDARACFGFAIFETLTKKPACKISDRTYIYSYAKKQLCFCKTSIKKTCTCLSRKK